MIIREIEMSDNDDHSSQLFDSDETYDLDEIYDPEVEVHLNTCHLE